MNLSFLCCTMESKNKNKDSSWFKRRGVRFILNGFEVRGIWEKIMLGVGNNLSRGVATASPDVTPLQQCLPLEPIARSNPKHPCPGEWRRALGVSSTSEDHSFGVSHLKPPAQVGKDELKCIKETVQNGSRNARNIIFTTGQLWRSHHCFLSLIFSVKAAQDEARLFSGIG